MLARARTSRQEVRGSVQIPVSNIICGPKQKKYVKLIAINSLCKLLRVKEDTLSLHFHQLLLDSEKKEIKRPSDIFMTNNSMFPFKLWSFRKIKYWVPTLALFLSKIAFPTVRGVELFGLQLFKICKQT